MFEHKCSSLDIRYYVMLDNRRDAGGGGPRLQSGHITKPSELRIIPRHLVAIMAAIYCTSSDVKLPSEQRDRYERYQVYELFEVNVLRLGYIYYICIMHVGKTSCSKIVPNIFTMGSGYLCRRYAIGTHNILFYQQDKTTRPEQPITVKL